MRHVVYAGLALILAACGGSQPAAPSDATPKLIQGLLRIDAADVAVSQSLPPQVTLHVVGQVPDVCTEVRRILQTRSANDVTLTIWTERPDGPCILLVPPPVERSVPLIGEFPPGEYVLLVNGFRVVFRV